MEYHKETHTNTPARRSLRAARAEKLPDLPDLGMKRDRHGLQHVLQPGCHAGEIALFQCLHHTVDVRAPEDLLFSEISIHKLGGNINARLADQKDAVRYGRQRREPLADPLRQGGPAADAERDIRAEAGARSAELFSA